MAWRLYRQISTNQWLQQVDGKGAWSDPDATPAAIHQAQVARAYGLSVENVEVWEGRENSDAVSQAIRALQVPTLPPTYPVCVSVRAAPSAVETVAEKKAAAWVAVQADLTISTAAKNALRVLLRE